MIICGLDLPSEFRLSLRNRLPGYYFEEYPAPALLSDSVCFPDLPFTVISDLLSYGLPIQIWTQKPASDEDQIYKQQQFFENGMAAVHYVNEAWIDPVIEIEPKNTNAILLIHQRSFQNLFRQIFLFAGIAPRLSVQSTAEFKLLLSEIATTKEELHVVVDLDQGDFLPALHSLSAWQKQNQKTIRLWAIRDFHRPGPDPILLQRLLQPFTRRIFEPHEGALALIEALFLFHPSLVRFSTQVNALQRFDGFRSASDILQGSVYQISDRDPGKLWHELQSFVNRLRVSLPFHWLYHHFEKQRKTSGVMLVDNGAADDR